MQGRVHSVCMCLIAHAALGMYLQVRMRPGTQYAESVLSVCRGELLTHSHKPLTSPLTLSLSSPQTSQIRLCS